MGKKIESVTTVSSATIESDKLGSPGSLDNESIKYQEGLVTIQNVNTDAEVPSTEKDYDRSNNPFSDPKVAAHYATLYEKSQYECRHVFDPTLEWSAAEERKIIRKLDWHVCLWAVRISKSC